MDLMSFGIMVGAVFAIALLIGIAYLSMHIKAEIGTALIVTTVGKAEREVVLTGKIICPGVHKYEVLELSLKKISISRMGSLGLICSDRIRADIDVSFYIYIDADAEQMLHVAEKITCKVAADPELLQEAFEEIFANALKTAGQTMTFEELMSNRTKFEEEITSLVMQKLNGYVLKNVAIGSIEQTSIEHLDENNIYDAEGRRLITEQTAKKKIAIATLTENQATEIKKNQVQANEARMELDKQQALTLDRTNREKAVSKSREKAASDKQEIQDQKDVDLSQLKVDEELDKEKINTQREVDKAQTNADRDLEVATEEKKREVGVEQVKTTKKISLLELEQEQAEQESMRDVAETRAQTVNVERDIAEAEEATKDLINKSAAERTRLTTVTAAETTAEAQQVSNVKRAEADMLVSEHRIQEAKNDGLSIEAKADAKIKMAEAVKIEESAAGLAKAEVGRVQGLADAEVGMAEAAVSKEKGLAEATVLLEKGRASAEVTERQGLAEAESIGKILQAKESGGEDARHMEIQQIQLENDRQIGLKTVELQAEALKANATVMSGALKDAEIKLFSNGDDFMNKIQDATMSGMASNAKMDSNDILSALKKDLVDGDGKKVQDLLNSLASTTNNGAVIASMAASTANGEKPDLIALLTSMVASAGKA